MEWISVKDRLPAKYSRVLVTDGEYICLHYKQPWCNWEGDEGEDLYCLPCDNLNQNCNVLEGSITHWMPLPKTLKEE